MESTEKTTFLGIQSLRAIAALLVVYQHSIYYVMTAKKLDYTSLLRIPYGALGVELFFVISGFVMASCLSKDRSLFLLNRATRIYPGYWFAILLSYCLISSFHDWTFSWASFLLVPATKGLNNSYAIPYWTLIYEMFFYILIYSLSLLAKNVERLIGLCCLWLLAVFIFNAHHNINVAMPQKHILFSPMNIYFIFGFIFAISENLAPKGKKILFLVLFGLSLLGYILKPSALQNHLIYATTFSLLIYFTKNRLRNPILLTLGNYSYGIYLIHVPIMLTLIYLIQKVFPDLQPIYLWSSVTLLTIMGATFFGKFEYYLHRWCKNFLMNKIKIRFYIPHKSQTQS